MQVVIDIPDDVYIGIVNHFDTFLHEMRKWGIEAIKNGTVLHEPHGDLIDRNEYFTGYYNDAREFLDKATTIIPAMKGANDDKSKSNGLDK